MKHKFTVIGLCALLALVAILAVVRKEGGRRVTQATKRQLVIAPDGTIAVPLNGYVTFVAEGPKATTNASPAATSSGKK